MEKVEKIEVSELKLIIQFLKHRFNYPQKSVAFVLYFITIIFLVGLTSSFVGLFDTLDFSKKIDVNQVSLSIIGYSIVLLSSSAIEFIFISFKDDEVKYSELKNAITMIGVASIIFGIILSLTAYYINIPYLKLTISLLMLIFVWFMWWVSNSRTLYVLNNNNLPPSKEKITGGNPNEIRLSGEIPTNIKS
ncbi:MAG: hypothetical protein ACOYLP_09570 [Flavobacterium sp.]|uniref:hypothetical protein n=1 Tax=Flavobacterium sp. TaxID=239 RepID=UPI003BC3FE26